jgi:hypothetical protein
MEYEKINVKNMYRYSEANVFSKIAMHMLRQGKKSVMPNKKTCAYRAKSGLQCAAGCLLTDEDYSPDFENQRWGHVAHSIGVQHHKSMIIDLQEIHDRERAPSWRKALRDYAYDKDLKLPADVREALGMTS